MYFTILYLHLQSSLNCLVSETRSRSTKIIVMTHVHAFGKNFTLIDILGNIAQNTSKKLACLTEESARGRGGGVGRFLNVRYQLGYFLLLAL